MAEPPISTATQGDMKARIADELARTDLTSEIADAIADAIDFYKHERFTFNETRDLTFNTVAGQDTYTGTDLAQIPTMWAFDYVILYLGNIPWPLHRETPIDVEIYNQNGLMKGQPIKWTFYNKSLRLGPVPDQLYLIRIAGMQNIAPPVLDTDTNNPWMIDAERLIRCRAKYELFEHVIRDTAKADRMMGQVLEAYDNIKSIAARQQSVNAVLPMSF